MRDEHVHQVHVDLPEPLPVFRVKAQEVRQQPVEGGPLHALHSILAGGLVVLDGSLGQSHENEIISQQNRLQSINKCMPLRISLKSSATPWISFKNRKYHIIWRMSVLQSASTSPLQSTVAIVYYVGGYRTNSCLLYHYRLISGTGLRLSYQCVNETSQFIHLITLSLSLSLRTHLCVN